MGEEWRSTNVYLEDVVQSVTKTHTPTCFKINFIDFDGILMFHQCFDLYVYMYMHMQLIHPFEGMEYRKTLQELREIGKKCINGRIALLERGEILPNDILSHILQIASKLLHSSDQSVRNII